MDDPHIIPVYEAGEAGGVLFIAMRFVPGRDLRAVLAEEGPLSPERVADFVSPVASALDAAHRAGLVHRDVKPANILVDERPGRAPQVYLSDFGVSKGALSSARMTASGVFLGTPDYAAPEQIQGLAVDGRADQYALACVAYQLLTGVPPSCSCPAGARRRPARRLAPARLWRRCRARYRGPRFSRWPSGRARRPSPSVARLAAGDADGSTYL